MPCFTVPVHEFNPCHTPAGSPQGGQFCSAFGTSLVRGRRVRRHRAEKQLTDDYMLLYSGEDRARRAPLSKRYLAALDRLGELEDAEKQARKANDPTPSDLTAQRRAAQEAILAVEQEMQVLHEEVTRKGIREIAGALGVDPARLRIVKEDTPRKFTVGGVEWSEGGHYNPETGHVQINIANPMLTGRDLLRIVAHEVMHAKFEVWRTALDRESDRIKDWYKGREGEVFYMNGDIKPQFKAEFRRLFPAHAAVADTWGHAYTADYLGQQMMKDDGFTDYSKAYWRDAKQVAAPVYRGSNYLGLTRVIGSLDRAMNETLAEVGAWRVKQRYAAGRYATEEAAPSREWRRFAARLNAFYRAHVKRGGLG